MHRDRRQPRFGAQPEEGLRLTASRGSGEGKAEESEGTKSWGD